MRTSKYKGEIYMTIDKEGVRWIGLRNDVTKLEENAAKYKKLLATRGEDEMVKEQPIVLDAETLNYVECT